MLHHSYLWEELWPFSYNATKRVSHKRKGFYTDSGLACYLQRITHPETLLRTPLLGSLFETAAMHQIQVLAQTLNIPPWLYHWRTNGGAEVDCIIEQNGLLYPIEIKAKFNPSAQDTRGIRAFYETYPDRCQLPGLILYPGPRAFAINEIAIAWPWHST